MNRFDPSTVISVLLDDGWHDVRHSRIERVYFTEPMGENCFIAVRVRDTGGLMVPLRSIRAYAIPIDPATGETS